MLAVMEDCERDYKGKNILIVSHEYPIWALVGGAAGLTDGETVALRRGKRAKDFITFAEVMSCAYARVPRDERGEINLHRPYVDSFVFPCAKCKAEMRRIPEVADVWFDSGAMPFAAGHWPFAHKNDLAFPAEFIAEAVDQTRGWFYTLLAVATLLGRKAPYKNVISLGHVLDKNGLKMSKSKGNVISPAEMIEKYGADALRWYFYTVNSPGDPKQFDEKDVATKMRGFLMTFWNSFLLFDTYAVRSASTDGRKETTLDVWIRARMRECAREVTEALDAYDLTYAGRALEEFVINDFSQWFLRRSRGRFQRPASPEELAAVSRVAGDILRECAVLAAPFVPFMAETVYQGLKKRMKIAYESVHLEDWPRIASLSAEDTSLITDMATCRAVCSRALSLRQQAGIKVRQPLASLTITERRLGGKAELLALIEDEVNVKQVIFGPEEGLDTVITPTLKEEGVVRDIVRIIQEMRKELGLAPKDKIRLAITGRRGSADVVAQYGAKISRDTHAAKIEDAHAIKSKIVREFNYEGEKLEIRIAL
jgi:isoleucyl-tRNA synthetase